MFAHELEQRPHKTLDIVVQAIDLIWDNVLEPPQNTYKVTARDPEPDGGQTIQEIFIIKRIYDTAYYIKCQISSLTSLGGKTPVFNTPIEVIEYRLFPKLFEKGKINITHTDSNTGITTQEDVLMDNLDGFDSTASKNLKGLQLNLLSLLIGHCKEVSLFDPFPKQVKELLCEVYDRDYVEDLWRTGMSDKDEP